MEFRKDSIDNQRYVASKEIPDIKSHTNLAAPLSQENRVLFFVAAYLKDWDRVGNSQNNLVTSDGTTYLIDFGGTLGSRARGEYKPGNIFTAEIGSYGPSNDMNEVIGNFNIDFLPSEHAWRHITKSDIETAVEKFKMLTDSVIKKIVQDAGYQSADSKEIMINALTSRRDVIVANLENYFVPLENIKAIESKLSNVNPFMGIDSLRAKDKSILPVASPSDYPIFYRAVTFNNLNEIDVLKSFFEVDDKHLFLRSHNNQLNYSRFRRYGYTENESQLLANHESFSAIKETLAESNSASSYLKDNQAKTITQDGSLTRNSEALFFSSNRSTAYSYGTTFNGNISIIFEVANDGLFFDFSNQARDEFQRLGSLSARSIKGVFIGRQSIRPGTNRYEYSYFKPIYDPNGRVVSIEKYDTQSLDGNSINVLSNTLQKFNVRSVADLKNINYKISSIESKPRFSYKNQDVSIESSYFLGETIVFMHENNIRYMAIIKNEKINFSVMTPDSETEQIKDITSSKLVNFFKDKIKEKMVRDNNLNDLMKSFL